MRDNFDPSAHKFGFGIEAEFLLLDKSSFRPLFYQDLNFDHLIDLLDAIPVSDYGSEGFNVKPLHRLASPYLVEGYYLTDEEMKPHTLLAKGVELRTPLASTIEQSVSSLDDLYGRLQTALAPANYATAIISHHPTESKFEAPPNYKRHDYWQWALTAMTTMGPDINISVPSQYAYAIDQKALHDKINYYMPALVALSLASPLLDGDLWNVRGAIGKSIRTYRRSLWAPLYYIHHKPSLRFEFKGFEMARNLNDYKAFFLMCLAVLLDSELDGSASDATRIYDLGQIAVQGLDLPFVRERIQRVLESGARTANKLGFDSSPLDQMWARLDSRRVPADDIIELFTQNRSIPETMRYLTQFDQSITFAPPAVAQLCLT